MVEIPASAEKVNDPGIKTSIKPGIHISGYRYLVFRILFLMSS